MWRSGAGFREYLAGLIQSRSRNKTLTCLADVEPVAGARTPPAQRLQSFALKSIRAARPDSAPIYVILDNLSAHKNRHILAWAKKHKVELLFTPTYTSWANPKRPTSGHYASSPWPTRTIPTTPSRLGRCTPTYAGDAHPRHPDVLAAQRRERARIRSEKGTRWGGRP
jgi:hypothetical protein